MENNKKNCAPLKFNVCRQSSWLSSHSRSFCTHYPFEREPRKEIIWKIVWKSKEKLAKIKDKFNEVYHQPNTSTVKKKRIKVFESTSAAEGRDGVLEKQKKGIKVENFLCFTEKKKWYIALFLSFGFDHEMRTTWAQFHILRTMMIEINIQHSHLVPTFFFYPSCSSFYYLCRVDEWGELNMLMKKFLRSRKWYIRIAAHLQQAEKEK